MINVDYLIVGGGVSGLTFANFIKSDDFLIIEKESELGGFCRTIEQDGFIWDYAGHFFHFADENIKDFFKDKISKKDLVERVKDTSIFFDGELIDFPFQSNIHQLSKDKFISCLYDLYFRIENKENKSFLEMLYSKFGKSITEYFLKPYNEKLYACDLNKLDVDAMGRFFPYANFDDVITSFKKQKVLSYNSTFLYPKKGAQVFVNALSSSIDKDKISLNTELESVDFLNNIAITSKGIVKYKYLINTSPLNTFIRKLGDSYSSFYDKLSYNKVLVFNIGFDKKSDNNHTHWMYFPNKEFNFYRIGFYDNILDDDRLSIYVELGFNSEDKIDVDNEFNNVLVGLKKAGIINQHQVVSSCSIIMDPAYVHVSEVSNIAKNEIKNKLSNHSIYTIGRYGDWKYCSIEDSMLDAVSLSENIK